VTGRGRSRRRLFAGALAAAFCGFVALGVWQLERRVWKLDLIARVEHRTHAAPAPAPGPQDWPAVSEERDAYRRVRISGVYLRGRDTLVQAVTELGPGRWVMTPLDAGPGFTVLINRGFVPEAEAASPPSPPRDRITVTGLLRTPEPHGGFLRANAPVQGRWYSRDVQAIAAARGLHRVAPYFIDADATPNADGWPRGGLTVIHFRNAHLSYALTWFAMAGLSAAGAGLVLRDGRRRRAACDGTG
jgi:surfeit locus 1 family protein